MMAFMSALLLLALVPAFGLTCDEYLPPEALEPVVDSPIVEASGLARSRARPGVWFTHNDAGGTPELYAFRLDGSFVETHAVRGAAFFDWEDLAAGPCPQGSGDCLYIGDIGDNGRIRQSVRVYAVEEPAAGEDAEVIATWTLSYPGGVSQDSETLFVHPRSGRIYLATKDHDTDSSAIYRLPEEPSDAAVELELVTSWTLEAQSAATTGGAWDPDGDRLAIRTYATIFEWLTDPCDELAHWGQSPSARPAGDTHGEAVAYDDVGGLVTVTEGPAMNITRLACAEAGEGSAPCDTGDAGTDADTDAEDDSPPLDSGDSEASPPDSGEPAAGASDCGACGGCEHGSSAGLLLALLTMTGVGRRGGRER
jgi:hypothetical protein